MLQSERFSLTSADTYAKEISNFVCYSSIERTQSTVFITFQYKPIDPNSHQLERYLLKVSQQVASVRCEVEDISPVNNESRGMKEHFLNIVKNVLQPYESSKNISEQQLSKNKSFVLEFSAIDNMKPGQRNSIERTSANPLIIIT